MATAVRESDPRVVLAANGADSEVELQYTVSDAVATPGDPGTTEYEDAETAILADAPETILDLPIDRVQLRDHIVRLDINGDELNDFRATVTYRQPQTSSGGGVVVAIGQSAEGFSTRGRRERVKRSLATSRKPASAADFGGLINVTEDGAEGTDIVAPSLQLSETHIFGIDEITPAFRANLGLLTGSINSATFRGFAAEQVLFLGVDGEKLDAARFRLVFNFDVKPRELGVTIDGISVGDVEGQDFVWIRTIPQSDTSTGAIIRKAEAVYVERLYPLGNFALLGI